MYVKFYLPSIFILVFFCTSCSNKQYQVLFQQKNALSDTAKMPIAIQSYRIKPQDILQIRNLQDINYLVNTSQAGNTAAAGTNSQGQTFQVEEDGEVALPVIGRLKVAGLTRVEAQKLVEDTYRKVLLKDPIIDLKIVNLKVTLLGEVKGQGNYILTKDKTTLVELIGEAGGLTDRSDAKSIQIIRGQEKKPEIINVDFDDIRAINDPRAILQSGDIVYVALNKRAARNDNLQNFSTVFKPALLLFNTALIIYTLIHK